jgi:hypothetical protein
MAHREQRAATHHGFEQRRRPLGVGGQRYYDNTSMARFIIVGS